ncbi:Cysteine-rich receptor-like protein kinase [Sesamum angolense]|uniref:Cysteine-rich receptor-like protein kinase n=1 Tax=Sesamum angolense TaxID=2727404 RepID=A0AAE1WGQ4_9LAMI|nr:Cysteine-rich receptor-like protein kinase [Sesamum angolense]
MHLSTSNFPHLPIPCFFLLLLFLAPFSLSDPRISEAGLFCGHSRPPNGSYIPLFVRGMEVLSQLVTANDWGNYAVNATNISIYTLAQCYADLSHNDCLQCYAASRTRLPRCLPAVSGRIFLDGCFLRYDSYAFFNESVDPAWDGVNCNSSVGAGSGVGLEFEKDVRELIDNVTASAVVNGRYAVMGSKGVFGLAECWNTVSREGCRACLAKASKDIRGCLPSKEGRALITGCYLRYSTQKFFSNQSQETNSNSGASRRGAIVAIVFSVVAFCMLCLFAAYAAYGRWKKRKQVKRLFFSTRQWVDEFFNEVNLISGIEHKNLVKLLGCSIEGPESLLVYEFVPNKSLEQYLLDKNKIKILNWKERYNIIVGTAEGIAFLHGGSEFRIIHRDIKSSNILLDENLDAKIADFGLARNFAADKTHLSTGIAGTLGYMAPEYLVKGQLTEKADVYSYGVLVLEIVCGRKNNAFVEDSGSLLQTVWKLYKTDRLTESVDPCLKGDFPAMEAVKVLKVGLLCAQASVAQRPSMAEAVRMLTDENYEIPEPNQPPFLNTSTLSASSTRSSYSINSLASNMVPRHETSYPSTESFSIQSSEGQSRSEEIIRLR